jgi:hypothetical protein
MPQFSFTLLIHGADVLTEDAQDALFDAGCGDATFGASDHVQRADFDREAADLAEANGERDKRVRVGRLRSARRRSVVVDRGLRQHGFTLIRRTTARTRAQVSA